MEFVLVLIILTAVVAVVGSPLRRPARDPSAPEAVDAGAHAPNPAGQDAEDAEDAVQDGREAVPDTEPVSAAETLAAAGELADLQAARDAKYLEIRDAELDHRTGKLSDADYAELDLTLRREAVEILDRLERAEGADEARQRELH